MFEMLKESNGNMSSIRVISLMITCAVLFVWVSISIKTWTVQPLDTNAMILVIGSLGAKVGQKFGEK